jgi:hypothetical protein
MFSEWSEWIRIMLDNYGDCADGADGAAWEISTALTISLPWTLSIVIAMVCLTFQDFDNLRGMDTHASCMKIFTLRLMDQLFRSWKQMNFETFSQFLVIFF